MGPPSTSEKTTMDDPAQVAAGDQVYFVPDLSAHHAEQRVLSLPPPPSYDVLVDDLSVGVPPPKALIPIPQSVKNIFSSRKKVEELTENQPEGDNLIVRNVTAQVKAGEMMAIIGGSGSGKTTLLHAIANRLGGLPIAGGSVSFVSSGGEEGGGQGAKLKQSVISNVVGFVRQHDYLLPHLTVRETLFASARLRLPTAAHSYISEIVEQTLLELGLSECADTRVGGSGTVGRKGISGGEKRRLSIGCVLVSFPSVLILDEVTTGLDSFTAYQLLLTLSVLARNGRTIILSLHQPRSDAFHLLDRIVLMSRGSVVYSGATKECLGWFRALGHTVQEATNPLDFLIDISSIDTRDEGEEKEHRERVNRLVQAWGEKMRDDKPISVSSSPTVPQDQNIRGNPAHSDIESGYSTVANAPPAQGAPSKAVINRPNVLQQSVVLLPRSFKNMWRAWPVIVGHFSQAVIIGVLMGITYYRLGSSPRDIQSLKTLAFQLMPVYAYLSQLVWTYQWCLALVVFDREREDGLYQPLPWMMSEYIAWLPVNVLGPVTYSIVVYFMSNMRTEDLQYNFGVLVLDMILIQQCFVIWALWAASIERSFSRAFFFGNMFGLLWVLSSGLFLVNVPGWIRWFRWVSPHLYSFRIIVISQLRNRDFACEGITGTALSQCSGNNALRALKLSPDEPLWPLFMGLLAFILVVLCAVWTALTFYKPGGVRHAQKISSGPYKREEHSSPEIDIIRERVDVVAENVKLTYAGRTLPSLAKVTTPILTGVSARFPSGQVSVIMGPSGSGKSTFLRMCADRPLKGGPFSSFVPEGQVLFNGVLASKSAKHACAFVEQDDDYHLPALTVRETLRYTAMIKLPSSVSKKTKIARAEEVLNMLGLRDCADVMVGGELLKGISGGEKRRLSLACQMINDPAVLILDEPTSGLDAYTARNVMETLRDIARSGRTVIASLHQPRSDIHNMVDNFTILAKQGNVIFHGPREQLLPHFALVGYICPPLYNPSDYCMDLISVDTRGAERFETSTARVRTLVDHWRERQNKMIAYADKESSLPEDSGITSHPEARPENSPIWIALPVLMERMMLNTWRQTDIFWTRWSQAPILSLFFYVFYLRLHNGPTGAQDRIGLIAQVASVLPFLGFTNLTAQYPMDKVAFFNDYKSAGRRYSSGTFITAFTLFAIIPEFVSAMLFSVIINVATGMRTNARIFFEFTVAIWVQLNFGESIGIAFASFFDTMGLSMSLVSVFLTVAAQSSAVFSASVATFLDRLAWIFPMKYSARIILINEMQGLQFDCSQESITSGQCSAVDGDQVLDLFGLQGLVPWKMTLICIAVTIAYRFAAWVVLSVRLKLL